MLSESQLETSKLSVLWQLSVSNLADELVELFDFKFGASGSCSKLFVFQIFLKYSSNIPQIFLTLFLYLDSNTSERKLMKLNFNFFIPNVFKESDTFTGNSKNSSKNSSQKQRTSPHFMCKANGNSEESTGFPLDPIGSHWIPLDPIETLFISCNSEIALSLRRKALRDLRQTTLKVFSLKERQNRANSSMASVH